MTDTNNPEKLQSISDIRRYFLSNQTPIYFISATNFNLLGADEWVGNFKFITHIDSFEGQHPNVFTPKMEMPHEEFQSIDDINNYLLQHPEVIDYIQSRAVNGNMGKALFLMFDEKTERLANNLGLEVCMPSAQLRNYLDNKLNTNRIAEKAGVPCVPHILSKVNDYNHLRFISNHLGQHLVIQTPFGDSGHTTFFISNEQEFDVHKAKILQESEVKIMKRIDCIAADIEGCVTANGTIVTPLMTELVGFKELTPYKGGWCGNEIFANAFNSEIREKAKKYTQLFGDQLLKEGYKGYFELDYLIDQKDGSIYLGELNPRFTGASSMTNHALFAYADVPLFLFHLLEWMDANHTLNTRELTEKWSLNENMDSWSQLVIKHTRKTLEFVKNAPASGIWEMQKNESIKFKKMDAHRKSILGDNEAFFMQIMQEDGYFYEGADLGILVMRGRVMSDDFILSPRAQKWIVGIHSYYKTELLESFEPEDELEQASGFKMI